MICGWIPSWQYTVQMQNVLLHLRQLRRETRQVEEINEDVKRSRDSHATQSTRYRLPQETELPTDCHHFNQVTMAVTAQLVEAVKHLIVSIDIKHGTEESEELSQWLQIWKSEQEDLGLITLETLGQWCRATTGQAGTLILDREDSGHRYFIYQMTHCGYCE